MLTQEATQEMIEAWKATWNEYKDKLHPTRKSGAEILEYLLGKYSLMESNGERTLQVVTENVMNNQSLAEKLPEGAMPSPVAFFVQNSGAGKALYENQDDVFKEVKILVGIDLASGCYCVEGSSMLWDELCAFQGLDEKDIQNPYCVYEYISCLKRFGLLNQVIDTGR